MVWKRTTLTIGALALLLLPAVAGAQAQQPAPAAQGKSLSLSLDDCIVRALKNNLAIQVAEFSPQLSEISLSDAQAQYLPTMTFRYTPSHSENASYSWLDTTGATTVRLTTTMNGSVNQQTPLGGTLSLTASQNRSDSNARGTTINPSYSTSLSFSYNQPLLRSFGPKITNRQHRHRQQQLRKLPGLVRQHRPEHDLLRHPVLLEPRLQRREPQGPASRPPAVQGAPGQERALGRDRDDGPHGCPDGPGRRRLARSGHPGRRGLGQGQRGHPEGPHQPLRRRGDGASGRSSPWTSPRSSRQKIEVDQALAVAMEKRPDLQISRLSLKNTDVSLAYAKNQLLPGLPAERLLIEPRPRRNAAPLSKTGTSSAGSSSGRSPGFAADAWKDAFKFKYQNWYGLADLEHRPERLPDQGQLHPGQAEHGPGRPEHDPAGAAGHAGDPQRRPLGPDELQAGPGLQALPGAERAEVQRRARKAPHRPEHGLSRPPVPARHDERPGLGAATRSSATTSPRPASTGRWASFSRRRTSRSPTSWRDDGRRRP